MENKEKQIEYVEIVEKGVRAMLDSDKVYVLNNELELLIQSLGYRKLPEDSVVLSREEICELKCQAEEDFNKAYDLGSKETAEKILNEIDCIPTNEVNELNHLRLLKMNIAKQFGVEIKEN